jgi:hypothetical protein
MRRILSTILFLLMVCCQACVRPEVPSAEPEYVTLSLGLGGEWESEDTRASSGMDLYGINVWYDAAKDGNINTRYAYGIFDNREDMVIQLLTGYHYKFACTLVKDGKSILYCGPFGGNTFNGYAKPFQTSSSSSTAVSNSFIYGTEYLSGIGSGAATLRTAAGGYEEKALPSLVRYYGEFSGYTAVAGGSVTIPLKKTVFGVRFVIEPVREGALSASCTIDSPETALWSASAGKDQYDSGSLIYSFPDVRACWSGNENLPGNVSWGFASSIFSQWNQQDGRPVTFKRNVLTTVTVSCSPDYAEGSLGVQAEEMGEDNEIYLYLNTDGLLVVGIKPEY